MRPAGTLNHFLEHFKTHEGTTLSEESIFEELDKEIVLEEIRNAVKNTKSDRKKSCGPDIILNKTFKY